MSFPPRLTVKTPLGPDDLRVEAFRGRMALSELFRLEVDLLAQRATKVPFEKLLGQPISVSLTTSGGTAQSFSGIISNLKRVRRDKTFAYFQALMVPQLWLWTRNVQSRVFQRVSIPEILQEVLKGLRPDLVIDLKGSYQPRDYCVQYRESDFDFASRLMEEEGIYYYFQHAVDKHVMVVTDTQTGLPDLPQPTALTLREDLDSAKIEPCISQWEKAQGIQSGACTLWDQCFELPGRPDAPRPVGFQNLEAKQTIQSSVQVGGVTHSLQLAGNDTLERYDYPGGYAQRFDGVGVKGEDRSADLAKIFDDARRTAKVRMEQEAIQGLQISGASTYGHLLSGYKFTLQGDNEDAGNYVLSSVTFEARQTGFRSGEEEGLSYRNRFTAIPVDLPYRPIRRTARPHIPGVQTATVVGPADQEIFTDKYGRVKVQFHWDRQGKFNAGSSCWVRVSQVWAGKNWGAFFWPRVGHEVVVAFVDGDPDKPLVIGSVYNAANMPPVDLPQEAMVGGIKSCSFGGEPSRDFNAIVFYDIPGMEYIQMHSMRSAIDKSMQDKVEFVPKARVSFHGDF